MLAASRFRMPQGGTAHCRVVNRRSGSRLAASVSSAHGPDNNNIMALSITANAAASALLAKVAALIATGVVPGVLPAALHPSPTSYKEIEKDYQSASTLKGLLADRVVSTASAPVPTTQSSASALALPAEWFIVTSAAEWFEQHRQAAAAGALLATVFVSDTAALVHAPLLERLRRNFSSGSDAPVRFVFVHIADEYQRRHRACAACAAAAAALPRGTTGLLTLGRVSHTAAIHGLDAALTSFLPDGVRAFPSLLLTAGPGAQGGADVAAAAPWSWSAATRVGEMTQLVSDWAFIIRDRRRRCQQEQEQGDQQQQRQQQEQQRRAGVEARKRSVVAAGNVETVLVEAARERRAPHPASAATPASAGAPMPRRKGGSAVLAGV